MRKLLLYMVAFGWVAILFAIVAPLVLLWPSLAWRNRLSLVAGRLWAGVVLWASGIRVNFEGTEHLRVRPAIFTFNHANVLDFFVNAYFADRRCLVFGKRELAQIPFLGWGWLLGGHPMLRRDDPSQWKAEMGRTQDLLRAGYSTIIAPEGKRSRDGTLLPFKKGAFHLALATQLPIVPVVIRGGADLLRKGEAFPGTITVRALPPVPTQGWQEATLEDHVAAVRELYLRELQVAQTTEASR
jgi:1-acyl-sn-glycerol-3-phosphate acyltransferase